jgi:hypothetical protein
MDISVDKGEGSYTRRMSQELIKEGNMPSVCRSLPKHIWFNDSKSINRKQSPRLGILK